MLNLRKKWDKAGVVNTLKYAGVSNGQSIRLLKIFSSYEWDILRIQTKYLEKDLKFAYMARAIIGRCSSNSQYFFGIYNASDFIDRLILELEEKYRNNPYTNRAGKTIYNEYCGYSFE